MTSAHDFVQGFAVSEDGWSFETDEDARRHDDALEVAVHFRDAEHAAALATLESASRATESALREELGKMERHATEGWNLANKRTRQWKDTERERDDARARLAEVTAKTERQWAEIEQRGRELTEARDRLGEAAARWHKLRDSMSLDGTMSRALNAAFDAADAPKDAAPAEPAALHRWVPDGVLNWKCPPCGQTWSSNERWLPPTHGCSPVPASPVPVPR